MFKTEAAQFPEKKYICKCDFPCSVGGVPTLQRQNTKILKQIFPEKEYRGLRPNFHIHASESDLYISTIGLPILLQGNM